MYVHVCTCMYMYVHVCMYVYICMYIKTHETFQQRIPGVSSWLNWWNAVLLTYGGRYKSYIKSYIFWL